MSQGGQLGGPWADNAGSVIVATFPMATGVVFDWHTHDDHQLAWAASGVLTVRTDSADWVLPPTRALWIPAGLKHETLSAGVATMRSLYLRPDRAWARWTGPVPVAVTPLLAELIGYMGTESLSAAERERAEALPTSPTAGTGHDRRGRGQADLARIAEATQVITRSPMHGSRNMHSALRLAR